MLLGSQNRTAPCVTSDIMMGAAATSVPELQDCLQAHQARLQQCILQQGGPLVQALLVALCETSPRSSMRPMAMLLHGLLTGPAWQEAARRWLADALQSAELQGEQCPPHANESAMSSCCMCSPSLYPELARMLQCPTESCCTTLAFCCPLPGVTGSHVTSADCSRMYSIATRVPPLPSMRFVGLVTDFANIARGEMTGDVLIAYEV